MKTTSDPRWEVLVRAETTSDEGREGDFFYQGINLTRLSYALERIDLFINELGIIGYPDEDRNQIIFIPVEDIQIAEQKLAYLLGKERGAKTVTREERLEIARLLNLPIEA